MSGVERTKRLQEIAYAILSFQKYFKPDWLPEPIPIRYNGAIEICNTYFDQTLPLIKSFLKEGRYTNRFKVASATELTCLKVSPFDLDPTNIAENRAINGAFSFYLAFQILHSIIFSEKFPEKKIMPALHWDNLNSPRKAELFELIKERLNWYPYFLVENKSIEELPIFINSHFWQAISYYLKDHVESI